MLIAIYILVMWSRLLQSRPIFACEVLFGKRTELDFASSSCLQVINLRFGNVADEPNELTLAFLSLGVEAGQFLI